MTGFVGQAIRSIREIRYWDTRVDFAAGLTLRFPGGSIRLLALDDELVLVHDGSWWDWDVLAWDSGQFRLAAGYDLSYHHGLELVFAAPLFISCPADRNPRNPPCGDARNRNRGLRPGLAGNRPA